MSVLVLIQVMCVSANLLLACFVELLLCCVID